MTATGRVAILDDTGTSFVLKDIAVPEPKAGAVLVQMTLTNFCASTSKRAYGPTRSKSAPYQYGHEGVGKIAALGEGVTKDWAGAPVRVGDRVTFSLFTPCGRCPACLRGLEWCCPERRSNMSRPIDVWPYFSGTFGDYHYVLPQSAFFKVPEELPDVIVSALNCAVAQVFHALDAGGVGVGDNVVIQGAGGLGLFAIPIAKERGAAKVIVSEAIPERLAVADAMGADRLLDLRELADPADRIRRVKELTGGWGADVVIEVAGKVGAVEEGIQMLGQGGRFVTVGMVRKGSTYAADPELWVHSNLRIIGNNNWGARHLKGALDLLYRTRDRYPYARIASHQYPLSEINHAFAEQGTGAVIRAGLIP
jgi:threonine dehydrogenase-like Zn-dependent dehydrogenase